MLLPSSPRLLRRLVLPGAVLLALASASACQDPCTALAERICQCEDDPGERLSCRQERVTGQRDRRALTDEERSICTAALDTCTCTALDQNRTDLCGFALEGPPALPDDAADEGAE